MNIYLKVFLIIITSLVSASIISCLGFYFSILVLLKNTSPSVALVLSLGVWLLIGISIFWAMLIYLSNKYKEEKIKKYAKLFFKIFIVLYILHFSWNILNNFSFEKNIEFQQPSLQRIN